MMTRRKLRRLRRRANRAARSIPWRQMAIADRVGVLVSLFAVGSMRPDVVRGAFDATLINWVSLRGMRREALTLTPPSADRLL
jgi:hypothetical protein